MSISQWTLLNQSGSHINQVSSGALEGGFSLSLLSDATSTDVAALRTSDFAHTTARIRTRVKATLLSAAAGQHIAIAGMLQSSIALASNTYFFDVYNSRSATGATLHTCAFLKGAAASFGLNSNTILTSASITGISAGALFTMQFKWQREPSTGFIQLTGYMGSAADFSDLAQVLVWTDNSSPYSTSVSGGVYAESTSGGTTFLIDVTQGFKV